MGRQMHLETVKNRCRNRTEWQPHRLNQWDEIARARADQPGRDTAWLWIMAVMAVVWALTFGLMYFDEKEPARDSKPFTVKERWER